MFKYFLLSNTDYLHFLSGIALLTVGLLALGLKRRTSSRFRWAALALFGLLAGIPHWLQVLPLTQSSVPILQTLRLMMCLLASMCLLEFGRAGTSPAGGKNHQPLVLSLLVATAAVAVLGGDRAGQVACYGIGLVGGAWSALALFRGASASPDCARRPLYALGVLLAAYGFLKAPLIPPLSAPVSEAVVTLLAWVALWSVYHSFASIQDAAMPLGARCSFAALVTCILAGGWLLTGYIGEAARKDMHDGLLLDARIAAASLNPEHVKGLSGTPRDRGTGGYQRLYQQLVGMRFVNSNCRWLYLMRLKSNRVIFLMDPEPENSEDESPPGLPYPDAPQGLYRVFADGRPSVERYSDQWGDWQSGFAAVKDRATGKVVAVLGMDIQAQTCQAAVAHERLLPIALTLVAVLILYSFFVAYQQQIHVNAQTRTASAILNLERQRLSVTLASIADGVIATDSDGSIFLMNAAAEVITGWSTLDAIGAPLPVVFRLLDEVTHDLCTDPLQVSAEAGEMSVTGRDCLLLTKDGSEVPLATSAAPIRDENREVVGFVVAFRDVAQRKQAEKELWQVTMNLMLSNEKLTLAQEELERLSSNLEARVVERTEQMEKLVQIKDGFIAQLGHDLKTPLTPLVGLLPMVRDLEQDPALREMLDVAIRSTTYMRELVQKTLVLAKVNSPTNPLNVSDVDVDDTIRRIVEDYSYIAGEHNAAFCVQAAASAIIQADAVLFQETVRNLIDNAIKYSPDGGTITISTRCDAGVVTVSVSDEGIGMTRKSLERIFDEYYKVDPSRHDLASSGLGLSICKRIVEKHGGSIWATSDGPGKGATLSFTMNVSHAEDDLAA